MGHVMGIAAAPGVVMYERSLKTQAVVSHGGVLLDVRTPVFGDTPTSDMLRLAANICQVNDLSRTFWTWRLYKAVEGCDWSVAEKDAVIEQMKQVSAQFPELWLGIRAKWQRGGMEYVKAGQLVAQTETETTSEEVGSGNREILAPAD